MVEEARRHFGDRSTHFVIVRDAAIMCVFPEHEDENGKMHGEYRSPAVAGADIDLGREYHLRPCAIAHAITVRNTLIMELFA